MISTKSIMEVIIASRKEILEKSTFSERIMFVHNLLDTAFPIRSIGAAVYGPISDFVECAERIELEPLLAALVESANNNCEYFCTDDEINSILKQIYALIKEKKTKEQINNYEDFYSLIFNSKYNEYQVCFADANFKKDNWIGKQYLNYLTNIEQNKAQTGIIVDYISSFDQKNRICEILIKIHHPAYKGAAENTDWMKWVVVYQ